MSPTAALWNLHDAVMAGEREVNITSSNSSRFGDTPLAFNMTRFASSGSEPRHFWRFAVSRYCGRDPMIEIDADAATLREMRTFIDRALETVATDGGRNQKDTPA